MLSRLFIAVVWSPAEKGLTSWLLFVMFNCVFITFPCGILGQVWCLIVSFPDLWRFSYLDTQELDVDIFSLLVYPLRSRGKDGHFANAQIVSG